MLFFEYQLSIAMNAHVLHSLFELSHIPNLPQYPCPHTRSFGSGVSTSEDLCLVSKPEKFIYGEQPF
jgi:hypothetical protein